MKTQEFWARRRPSMPLRFEGGADASREDADAPGARNIADEI